MKQFEVNGQQYLAVEIPEGLKFNKVELSDFPFGNQDVYFVVPDLIEEGEEKIIHTIELPKGRYKLFCLVKAAPLEIEEAFCEKYGYPLDDNDLILNTI